MNPVLAQTWLCVETKSHLSQGTGLDSLAEFASCAPPGHDWKGGCRGVTSSLGLTCQVTWAGAFFLGALSRCL